MTPFYRNFRGEILEIEKTKCYSFGEVALLDDETLEVTELPIGTWTENFAAKDSRHKLDSVEIMLLCSRNMVSLTKF